MNGEELLKEMQFKEDMEKLINSYVKEVSALHLLHTVQQASEELKKIAVMQLDEARKEQEKLQRINKEVNKNVSKKTN